MANKCVEIESFVASLANNRTFTTYISSLLVLSQSANNTNFILFAKYSKEDDVQKARDMGELMIADLSKLVPDFLYPNSTQGFKFLGPCDSSFLNVFGGQNPSFMQWCDANWRQRSIPNGAELHTMRTSFLPANIITLEEFMSNQQQLDIETFVIPILLQMAQFLSVLESKSIMNYNLTLNNIFVFEVTDEDAVIDYINIPPYTSMIYSKYHIFMPFWFRGYHPRFDNPLYKNNIINGRENKYQHNWDWYTFLYHFFAKLQSKADKQALQDLDRRFTLSKLFARPDNLVGYDAEPGVACKCIKAFQNDPTKCERCQVDVNKLNVLQSPLETFFILTQQPTKYPRVISQYVELKDRRQRLQREIDQIRQDITSITNEMTNIQSAASQGEASRNQLIFLEDRKRTLLEKRTSVAATMLQLQQFLDVSIAQTKVKVAPIMELQTQEINRIVEIMKHITDIHNSEVSDDVFFSASGVRPDPSQQQFKQNLQQIINSLQEHAKGHQQGITTLQRSTTNSDVTIQLQNLFSDSNLLDREIETITNEINRIQSNAPSTQGTSLQYRQLGVKFSTLKQKYPEMEQQLDTLTEYANHVRQKMGEFARARRTASENPEIGNAFFTAAMQEEERKKAEEEEQRREKERLIEEAKAAADRVAKELFAQQQQEAERKREALKREEQARMAKEQEEADIRLQQERQREYIRLQQERLKAREAAQREQELKQQDLRKQQAKKQQEELLRQREALRQQEELRKAQQQEQQRQQKREEEKRQQEQQEYQRQQQEYEKFQQRQRQQFEQQYQQQYQQRQQRQQQQQQQQQRQQQQQQQQQQRQQYQPPFQSAFQQPTACNITGENVKEEIVNGVCSGLTAFYCAEKLMFCLLTKYKLWTHENFDRLSGVPRFKVTYRKLALLLHPDKGSFRPDKGIASREWTLVSDVNTILSESDPRLLQGFLKQYEKYLV